jgi:hypothetical protein
MGKDLWNAIGEISRQPVKEIMEKCERMAKVFHLDVPAGRENELIDLCMKAETLSNTWTAKIGEHISEDVADPEILEMYRWLAEVYATGSTEYVGIVRKIREILFPNE